jgi:hypothetical protein
MRHPSAVPSISWVCSDDVSMEQEGIKELEHQLPAVSLEGRQAQVWACTNLWGLGQVHSHLRKSSGLTSMLFQVDNMAPVAKHASLAVSDGTHIECHPSLVIPTILKKNARLGDKRRIADNETPLVETHGFAA